MAKLSVPTDLAALKPIVEAMIFASEEPLGPRTLIRLLFDDPTKKANARQKKMQDASLFEGMEEVVETPDEGVGEGTEPKGEDAAASEQNGTEEQEIVATEEVAESTENESVEGSAVPEGEEEGSADEDDSAEVESAEDDIEADDAAEEEEVTQDEEPAKIGQKELRLIIEELNEEYELSARPFRIVEIAGGFQFATTREFGEFVGLLSKERSRRRLSQAALETLAIVAYRQPVTKPEVEAIRGVNCDQVLLSLLERNLLAITGRADSVGKPLLYGSTDEFLRVFGLNSLSDLPKLRELEELMEEEAHSPTKPEVIPSEIANELLELAYEAQGGKKEDEDAGEGSETDTEASDDQGEQPESGPDQNDEGAGEGSETDTEASDDQGEQPESGSDQNEDGEEVAGDDDEMQSVGEAEEKDADDADGEESVNAEVPLNPLVSSEEIEAHLQQQEAGEESDKEAGADPSEEEGPESTDPESDESASDVDMVADSARA